jgi:hypothetical protein
MNRASHSSSPNRLMICSRMVDMINKFLLNHLF